MDASILFRLTSPIGGYVRLDTVRHENQPKEVEEGMISVEMRIVICPGIHSPELTEQFIAALGQPLDQVLIVPSDRLPVYSPQHIFHFLAPAFPHPLLFIAFSAGVVGAIGAARLWQRQGGTVQGLIAIDGWGVPLFGDFPIHHMSHDFFTHWSSAFLGEERESFYADPPVEHLTLWHSPDHVQGYKVVGTSRQIMTAQHFLMSILDRT